MSAACEHCTGSHWLLDNPDLGQCVCCTPEALSAAEDELDEAQAERDDLRETVREAWKVVNAALCLPSDYAHTHSLADKIDDALDEAAGDASANDTRPDALEALQRYLVRLGLPSDPVTLNDPDLWALYEALT